MMVTYFVVQGFTAGRRGALIPDEPVQAKDEGHAVRVAERLAETRAGVIAFSREGDLASGEFDDAKILYGFGKLPPIDGEPVAPSEFDKEEERNVA